MVYRRAIGGSLAYQLFNAVKSHRVCTVSHERILLLKRTMAHSSLGDIDLAGMRKAYKNSSDAFLESQMVSTDPFQQFGEWFKLASELDDGSEANAMVLATATKDGMPSARFVLLKGFDDKGFKFYTNYESRKAKEMMENPRASLVFYWAPLHKSVRIEGIVEKLTEEESTDYFHSRPKNSQISACVSHQSTPIHSRQTLVAEEKELAEKYKDPESVIPRPDFWGGFRVKPEVMEFWQGQSTRLHDRIVFRKLKSGEEVDGKLLHHGQNGWVYERLAP